MSAADFSKSLDEQSKQQGSSRSLELLSPDGAGDGAPLASARHCQAPRITQDQDYDAARSTAINEGFQSQLAPIYGFNEDDEKISECGSVATCNAYPEIETCGTGHCAMAFRDPYGNELRIYTYGELGDGAVVTSFEMNCKP